MSANDTGLPDSDLSFSFEHRFSTQIRRAIEQSVTLSNCMKSGRMFFVQMVFTLPLTSGASKRDKLINELGNQPQMNQSFNTHTEQQHKQRERRAGEDHEMNRASEGCHGVFLFCLLCLPALSNLQELCRRRDSLLVGKDVVVVLLPPRFLPVFIPKLSPFLDAAR